MANTEKKASVEEILSRGYFEFNAEQWIGRSQIDKYKNNVDVRLHFNPDTDRIIVYRDYTSGHPDPRNNGIPLYTVFMSKREVLADNYNISAYSNYYTYDGALIGEKWHQTSVINDCRNFQGGGTLKINKGYVQWSSFRNNGAEYTYPLDGNYDFVLPASPESVMISNETTQFIQYFTAYLGENGFDESSDVDYVLSSWRLFNCLVSEDKEGIYNYLHGGDLPDDVELIDPSGDTTEEDDGDDGDEDETIGTTVDNEPYITPEEIRGASNYYAMNQGNVESFINWLWFGMLDDLSDLILNKTTKIYNNIADNIESIRLFPLDVADNTAGTKAIILGRANAPLSVPTVKKQLKMKHSEFTLKGKYANAKQFYGYPPYSNCFIYLPFVGFKELPLDIWGAKSKYNKSTNSIELEYPIIEVWYGIDFRSGMGICQLKRKTSDGNALIEEYDCPLAIDIPYSAETGFRIVSDIMNAFTEVMPQAKMMKSIINGKTNGLLDIGNVETSYSKSTGSRNSAASIFNPFHCYILNTHSVVDMAGSNLEGFNHAYGRICMNSFKLANIKGFTICENVDIHFSNTTVEGVKVSPTQNEWEELKILLESGVYL